MYKFAVVSDIHLGHKRNDTTELIHQLKVAFPDNTETGELDIIFIAGDLFDRLLDLANLSVAEIQLWMAYMVRLCSTRDIKLRILEGTASHDWKQSEMFMTVASSLGLPIDIQYIKTVHIEYMEAFGINILYMPDDWNHDHNDTLLEIKELMASKGLKTVDLGIFHGNFEYQLPPAAKSAPRHDSSEYLNLVDGLIFIGHIHTFSCFHHIYAQGSFGRLNHNEEEAKGHCRATVRDDKSWDVKFVENKLARKYLTIKVDDLSLDDVIKRVHKVCAAIPDDSCVRLQGAKDHPAMHDLASFVRLYPTMNWTKDPKKKDQADEKGQLSPSEILALHYTPVHIDRHNVVDLVMERIRKTYGDNPTLISNARQNLMEYL